MADIGPRDRLDDWFDEPEPPDAWSTRIDRLVREREQPREIEDWIVETRLPAPERGPTRRRPKLVLLGLAGLAVVLALGILAAVGGFSSGDNPRTAPPTRSSSEPSATTTPKGTTSTTLAVPAAPLASGAVGRSVEELQRALARVGYPAGRVDGSYGPSTRAAVAGFQHAHALTADGVAGPKTLAALAAALEQRTG